MGNVLSIAKDRADEIRNRIDTESKSLEEMAKAWREESYTDESGKARPVVKMTDDEYKAYTDKVNEIDEMRRDLTVEEKAMGIFEFLGQPAEPGSPAAAADARDGRARPEYKSLGQSVIESDEWKDMLSSGFKRLADWKAEDRGMDGLQTKDVFSALGGTVEIPTFGRAQSLGWTERTLRPGRVRDLFPAERTDAAILYGVRETGYTNRARVVPERTAANGTDAPVGDATDVFGLKPKSELTIVPVTYPIATIAHIMYVHRNTLEDEPRIRGLMDRDMVDGVKMAEDAQLLYGDGVGDNLTGILNTPGIQTYTGLSSDKRSAQIRRAATRALLAYFQPTGVVLHPYDWESIELETDENGAYTVALSVAVGGEMRVWRLNVVDTPAITAGTALVGAFGTGAKVYDREQVRVDVSTENRDFFERNVYTLRAEERVGLVVDRPESFVKLQLTTPA